jgi:hypothetical protein
MNLKTKLKVLDKEEGHLRYQREKQSRQRVLDVEAVNILKWGVESKRLNQIERKDDRMTKRMDALIWLLKRPLCVNGARM